MLWEILALLAIVLLHLPLGFFSCCCETFPCTDCKCEDQFTRSNNTDIDTGSPVGWTEVAGDWSIASNTLAVSSTGALAVGTKTYNGSALVAVFVTGVSSGDKFRLILGYADTDNYLYAEFTVGSAGTGYIKIVSRAGGSDTVLREMDPHATNFAAAGSYMSFCYDKENGRAMAGYGVNLNGYFFTTSYFISAFDVPEPPPGGRPGLGTGGTLSGTINFDGFAFNGENTVSPCQACRSCGAWASTSSPSLAPTPVARYVDVAVAGLGNGSCGSCTTLNQNVTAEHFGYVKNAPSGGGAFPPCIWGAMLDTPACGYDRFIVWMDSGTLGGGSVVFWWNVTFLDDWWAPTLPYTFSALSSGAWGFSPTTAPVSWSYAPSTPTTLCASASSTFDLTFHTPP